MSDTGTDLEDLEIELIEIKHELSKLNETCELIQADLSKRSVYDRVLKKNTETIGLALWIVVGLLVGIAWRLF